MANVDTFNEGWDAGSKGNGGIKPKKAPKPIGKITTSDGQTLTPTSPSRDFGSFTPKAEPRTFKKGGKVKKTGFAKVHAGEVVLTAKQAKKVHKKSFRKRVASKG